MNFNHFDEDDFFKTLEKESGGKFSPEQRMQMVKRVKRILNYTPQIGFFGKTGAGKSSLCNAIFGKKLYDVSDVEACTRAAHEETLKIGGQGIKLMDFPGVGENRERDAEYEKLYKKHLPELDLVLWVLKADDRAYSSDEKFYKNLVKPHLKDGLPFFFVLNQVDKIEPFREWNEHEKKPGPTQFANIEKKIQDVAEIFDIPKSKIIPVSANEKYNIVTLVDEFIRALPPEKRAGAWRAISYDNKSRETEEKVKESFWSAVLGAAATMIAIGVKLVFPWLPF